MGYIDSHRVNRRISRAVFPGLVAISKAAGLVHHPRSYDLSVASVRCEEDWWKAKARLVYFGDSRCFRNRHPDVVTDEFIR